MIGSGMRTEVPGTEKAAAPGLATATTPNTTTAVAATTPTMAGTRTWSAQERRETRRPRGGSDEEG